MTSFRFADKVFDDFTIVRSTSMQDYEQFRLKTADLTIDIAIVDLADKDKDAYINQRKEELSEEAVSVPHPYKNETQTPQETRPKLIFHDDPLHGRGAADHEYNLVSDEGHALTRYQYVVTWKSYPDRQQLAEIEAFLPLDADIGQMLKRLRSLELYDNKEAAQA